MVFVFTPDTFEFYLFYSIPDTIQKYRILLNTWILFFSMEKKKYNLPSPIYRQEIKKTVTKANNKLIRMLTTKLRNYETTNVNAL